MPQRALKSILVIFFLLSLYLFLPSQHSSQASPDRQGGQYSLYLPVLLKRFRAVSAFFGAEVGQINSAGGLDQLVAAQANWVRRNAVLWSDVEPTPGVENWRAPSIASLDQELINAANQGISVILIVRSTPSWAQKVPGSYCSPISQTALGAFGSFMHDLVARYSAPPYNVKYWEIWNEPDAPSSIPGDSVYGCWGDQNDLYYGGRYYGTMLQTISPQIKAADPQAQVIVGGLLLDCDPRGACAAGGWSDRPAKFLEGILVGGGGPYFDGVAFHAYDVYWYQLGRYGLSHWNSAWNTTGPVVIAKSDFVKSVLASYGLTSKFLMNTESGLLLCDKCPDDAAFETTKAYYVAQLYAAATAQGLKADIWYSMLDSFQNSGLLDSAGNPRPAYNAFKFASAELKGTQFSQNLNYPGLKGYELDRGDIKIWVLWSLNGGSHTIALPGVPIAAFHVDGAPMSASASLTITLEPVYLEWSR